MKILVSGGHLTPATAFIDFVQKNTQDQVVFVGRRFSQTSLQQQSVEKEEMKRLGVPFVEFDSGKVDFHYPFRLPGQLIKVLFSVQDAGQILALQKPDIFLSFGGYLAVPIAIAAKLRGIPVITHEQTTAPGLANQFISRFATKVAVTFDETKAFFPAQKTVVTGNPVRALWQKKVPRPDWLFNASQRPLLYVTGGSQGSQALNLVIKEILPGLLDEWDVVHQCGKANSLMNYQSEMLEVQKKLPTELQSRYVVREWVGESELAWIYQHAWAMISRSGANTVQEVVFSHIPTLFVPLPNTRNGEQQKNAQALVQKKAALLLTQRDLTKENILTSLNELKKNHQNLTEHLEQLAKTLPQNGDERLYQLVLATAHVK